MNIESPHCEVTCGEIAAYLDTELTAEREMSLEMHFAECGACREELNLQKQLLRGLDSEFRSGVDIVLPKDFAKVVAANAESTVAGLRRARERSNALFICGGLSLFVLLTFGVGAGTSLFFEQIAAVALFVGHLCYEIFIGVVVILRTAASAFRADVVSAFLVAGAAVIFLLLSRRLLTGRPRV
ncbi:MAG: anti-sigma factor family protein [Pyrinomonadaceae bacterium]